MAAVPKISGCPVADADSCSNTAWRGLKKALQASCVWSMMGFLSQVGRSWGKESDFSNMYVAKVASMLSVIGRFALSDLF